MSPKAEIRSGRAATIACTIVVLELFGATLLGAAIAEISSRLTRQDERAHVRRERVRERQVQAVAGLDKALDTAHAELPVFAGTLGTEHYWRAQRAWQDGYFGSAAYVRDVGILERYDAAGWALLSAALHADRDKPLDDWIVQRALRNARAACAAFVLEEELPPASFPSKTELAKLVDIRPTGLDTERLFDWLGTHPEPNS